MLFPRMVCDELFLWDFVDFSELVGFKKLEFPKDSEEVEERPKKSKLQFTFVVFFL
jgi:hypothetical protein